MITADTCINTQLSTRIFFPGQIMINVIRSMKMLPSATALLVEFHKATFQLFLRVALSLR